MRFSPKEECELAKIRETKQLTADELDAVRTYGGLKEANKLNPKSDGPGSILYYKLKDILKKYREQ
jgi:hypothetical protein